MAKVISSFGIYLGSLEPSVVGDCQTWTIFMATDDLALVPVQIELRVGGMVYTAEICPRKWIKGQVYQRSDLPPSPIVYQPPGAPNRPSTEPITATTMLNSIFFQEDDVIPMKLSALREIFRNFSAEDLPVELAACLAGNEQAIAANQAAYKIWEVEDDRRRKVQRTGQQVPPVTIDLAATKDPNSAQLMPTSSRLQASPHSTPPTSHVQHQSPMRVEQAPTVHRTEASRGKRSQADMAMQVCSLNFQYDSVQNSKSWDPTILFPEISGLESQQSKKGGRGNYRRVKKGPTKNKVSASIRPRRSTRNKNSRIANGDKGLIEIAVQDFLEVPLRNEEGRELLALIGAHDVSIPNHIIQMPNIDPGQPSGAQAKKNKQVGPANLTDPGPLDNNQTPQQADAQEANEAPSNAAEAQPDNLSIYLNQLGSHNANEIHDNELNALLQSNDDGTAPLDDMEEDPYLDQVDYSDEDVAL